jgi:putative effector of murein hydrolase
MEMKKFWNIFWKVFGTLTILTLIIGIIIGFASHSAGTTYTVIQGTIAVGLGLCGIIGIIVVPVEMFLEERAKGKGIEDAAE